MFSSNGSINSENDREYLYIFGDRQISPIILSGSYRFVVKSRILALPSNPKHRVATNKLISLTYIFNSY